MIRRGCNVCGGEGGNVTERRTYRALVNTGAEVSVISSRVFRKLRPKLELQKKDIKLRTANGSPLHVDGLCRLQIEVVNMSTPHDFFVVKNLNRNAILGRDWLMQKGVRMYFDLGALRIGEEYVALEEDVHISSISTKSNIKTPTSSYLYRTNQI